MPTPSRRTVATLAASVGLLAALGFAVAGHVAADDTNIVKALRAGGFVIVVRHGATFPDQADTDPLNFDNIAAQRNLNDKGKALAKAFGDAIREAGVSVGKVYTSKYNRAYETAVTAGFKDIEKTADITEGGLVVSPNENNRRVFPQAARHRTDTWHQHDYNYAQAEYRRRARQGLVRRQRGRSYDLPAGERQLQAHRPRTDGRLASHGRAGEVRLRKQHRHRTKRPALRPNLIAIPAKRTRASARV